MASREKAVALLMTAKKAPGRRDDSESVKVRLSDQTIEHLDRLAKELGMPKTELFSRLVEWFVRQPETVQDGMVRRRKEVPPADQTE